MSTFQTSGQWSVVSGQSIGCGERGQGPGVRGQGSEVRAQGRAELSTIHYPLPTLDSRPSTLDSPHGFTLVELLVTITIIGIMASIAWGAVSMARNSAREYATKATIAKLHSIIMKQYDSFATRRLPKQGGQKRDAVLTALAPLEMPVSAAEINSGGTTVSRLTIAYRASLPTNTDGTESAQCLYLIVSKGSPEALEQFNQSEIGVTTDGKSYFMDGWKKPIRFSRSPTDQLPIISSDHNITNQIIDQR